MMVGAAEVEVGRALKDALFLFLKVFWRKLSGFIKPDRALRLKSIVMLTATRQAVSGHKHIDLRLLIVLIEVKMLLLQQTAALRAAILLRRLVKLVLSHDVIVKMIAVLIQLFALFHELTASADDLYVDIVLQITITDDYRFLYWL